MLNIGMMAFPSEVLSGVVQSEVVMLQADTAGIVVTLLVLSDAVVPQHEASV